ncbi:glutamine--fructose-6-phosphate transaminase (isomerizing) [Pontiella sulfatireligans]|uniref:Glutamine--fructose-6-phosphate aminotransferase [isomerizing] n=1 Tax=Pontiella sulfatireligans TaxID=2750658 RepID=A0A6C2UDM4_9BACT|nr:glutamine--fructose-6-phosphate transaminase (isomerizing) [Pontiella sulfatireligans]VGO18235.1 Glutamine--fructose-6-phosphate aminotransferase [isomerizing] [Pontiella sulfatireligans]
MCGIVGYFGKRNASEILVDGLRRMEYRGYDSAGIACLYDGEIGVVKCPGKIKGLREKVDASGLGVLAASTLGIGHTRWATHGPPNEINAHPHMDASGHFVMVHNGIIENYKEIRKGLSQQGIECISDTDSEALIQLIAYCYKDNLEKAVSEALKKVKGTYGIVVLTDHEPDKLVTARCGSPIVLGLGKDETLVASDAAAIIPHTRDAVYLEDFDMAVITADGVTMFDLQHAPVNRETTTMDWDEGAAEKGDYKHFMLKEMFEQPDAIRNAIRGRLDFDMGTAVLSGLEFSPRDSALISRVLVVGCGTSMHAGMVGEYAFEEMAGIPAEVEQAAEFRYRNPIITPHDLVVAISQSGETADTLAAVREAKHKGATVAGICNVVGSTIARETGRGVYLHAGPEIGVASTKAFTCQVSVMLMMALKIARTRRMPRHEGEEMCRWIERLPELVEKVLEQNDAIKAVAEKYAKCENAFFIGRGYLFPVALEGALKLKEISYVHAEGYHAAELKHGPIALLQENTPVVALLNDIPGKDKTLGNAEECKARNAPVIAVVSEGDEEIADEFNDVIVIPNCPPSITPIPTVVALQLLSYHIAAARGCEIDQPRNLAKSVTVE